MRVAPHVQLLRRAADVDRDRLERELRLACRPCGVGLFGFGRLGGILGRGRGLELRLRVGSGGCELRAIAVNICVPIGLSGLRIVTGTSMLVSNTSPPPSGAGLCVLRRT